MKKLTKNRLTCDRRTEEARDLFEVYEEALETKEKYNRLMWLYGDLMDIFVKEEDD